MLGAHLQNELTAIEVWHHEVGHDDIHVRRFAKRGERFASVAGDANAVTEPREEAVQRQTNVRLIVDNEHVFAGGSGRRVGRARASSEGCTGWCCLTLPGGWISRIIPTCHCDWAKPLGAAVR